jgi:LPXTG-motif cell wall-anchored protein
MTALRVIRTVLVAVVLVLAVGTATASAQTAPTLTTDAPQYLPGTTITVTGAGYPAQCTAVNLNTAPGFTVVTDIAPVNGGFTATFTAPTALGTYELSSQQSGVAGCSATPINFDVVSEITTTTTTTTTTTGPTTTSGGPTTSSSVAASSSATTALARTGSNPGLLVAAGIAIAVGLVFVAASRRRSVS